MFLSRKRLEKYVLRLGLLSEVGNLTELVLKEFKCEVEGLRCKTRSSQNLDFLKKVCSENILIKSLTVQSLKMLHISKMTIIYYMYHLFFFLAVFAPLYHGKCSGNVFLTEAMNISVFCLVKLFWIKGLLFEAKNIY